MDGLEITLNGKHYGTILNDGSTMWVMVNIERNWSKKRSAFTDVRIKGKRYPKGGSRWKKLLLGPDDVLTIERVSLPVKTESASNGIKLSDSFGQ